jgi:uroporphyrinogen decarboxylase
MSSFREPPLWPHLQPDFDRLLKAIQRRDLPDRVPFIELFADPEIINSVLGEPPLRSYPPAWDKETQMALLQRRLRFCQKLGYDYVWAGPVLSLQYQRVEAEDTAELTRNRRRWVDESHGLIESMRDFEAYPWPTPGSTDYSAFDYLSQRLPDGIRIIGLTSGVLENVMWLMGYAPFALALYEQPELVEAMFEKVSDLLYSAYETMCDYPAVGAVFLGDDMGHRTGTMIHPNHLRQYVFPRQKRLVEIAHDHGMPFFLHACGNLRQVMGDLIDDVGIDAKHSYEDTYLPVTEAKKLYGERIAILGGVDVDFLVRGSEADVRAYTRRVLEACMPGGGYALGTGNSVANYIPVGNYLAMLDEGVKVGSYR